MKSEAAFPHLQDKYNQLGECVTEGTQGMSLLDYFAAEAMKELMKTSNDIASESYDMAEAMMAERKRRSEVLDEDLHMMEETK